MSRTAMFVLAGVLGAAGVVSLLFGVALLRDNVRGFVSENYRQYNTDADGAYYACSGSPAVVADRIAAHQRPEARATDRGSTYLRYGDEMVIVGPDMGRPCSVRVEDLGARYSNGGFVYLGPGFTPGSPAGGSGGSSGGPDGSK